MTKHASPKAENAQKPKSIDLEIEIPAGLEVSVNGDTVKVKGPKGEISKKLKLDFIGLEKKDNKVLLTSKENRKFNKAVLGAAKAKIDNMINGVTNGVTYKMKIVYSHFPMSAKVGGDKLVIDNFLGEKYPRKAPLLTNVTVEVKGQDVTVKGIDKEFVSQTAASIEQTTRIKGRDLRVFQDGIYITEKNGKPVK